MSFILTEPKAASMPKKKAATEVAPNQSLITVEGKSISCPNVTTLMLKANERVANRPTVLHVEMTRS